MNPITVVGKVLEPMTRDSEAWNHFCSCLYHEYEIQYKAQKLHDRYGNFQSGRQYEAEMELYREMVETII